MECLGFERLLYFDNTGLENDIMQESMLKYNSVSMRAFKYCFLRAPFLILLNNNRQHMFNDILINIVYVYLLYKNTL